ncbi:MAG: hypothetical protein HGA35_05845, partial [Erysipelotrichaceae bacterium]|nr:hypothetical protein [Erysipelotrichaceae bacterium]
MRKNKWLCRLICSALLTPEKVVITNIPDIVDVNNLIDLAASMGVEILFRPDITKPFHSNGMFFEAFDASGKVIDEWTVYSVGGGALMDKPGGIDTKDVYPFSKMSDLLKLCDDEGKTLW